MRTVCAGRVGAGGSEGDDGRSTDMGRLGNGCVGGGRGALGAMVRRSDEDLRETLLRRSRGSFGWRGMRVYTASDAGSCLCADEDCPGLDVLSWRAWMSASET